MICNALQIIYAWSILIFEAAQQRNQMLLGVTQPFVARKGVCCQCCCHFQVQANGAAAETKQNQLLTYKVHHASRVGSDTHWSCPMWYFIIKYICGPFFIFYYYLFGKVYKCGPYLPRRANLFYCYFILLLFMIRSANMLAPAFPIFFNCAPTKPSTELWLSLFYFKIMDPIV